MLVRRSSVSLIVNIDISFFIYTAYETLPLTLVHVLLHMLILKYSLCIL